MNTLIALLATVSLALAAAGCNKDSGSSASSSNHGGGGAIAVVDPDRIAATVGWGTDAKKNIDRAEADVRKQIDAHMAPARLAFEHKKSEIFTAAKLTQPQIDALNSRRTTKAEMEKLGMTTAQIDDLLQASTVWQNELASANNAIQQAMARQSAAIQNAVREVLNPLIRRVANAEGKSAVFYPPQGAYFDPGVDITDDVIKEIQKLPSLRLNLPDAPRIEFSTTQPVAGPATAPATEPSSGGSAASPATKPG